jgi:hypothetical protein
LDYTVDTLRYSFPIILVTITTIVADRYKWLGVDIGVGRHRVVERSHVGNRCLNTQFNLDKNGDRVGPFRGISGTLGRE